MTVSDGVSLLGGGGTSPSPITTSAVPTGTSFPSSTRISATVPAAGDGISTVALSVWISTSGSSSATVCPTVTSQRATSPSATPSPRSGSLNSYATARLRDSELQHAPDRRGHPRRRRQVLVLDRPVRIGHVEAGHADDRRLEVEDRLLGQERGELGAEARDPGRFVDDDRATRLCH